MVRMLLAPLMFALPARADDPGMCRVINIDFTPGGIPAGTQGPEIAPQIVATAARAAQRLVRLMEASCALEAQPEA